MEENLVARILSEHKSFLLARSANVMKNIESDKMNIALNSGLWALQWFASGLSDVEKAIHNTGNLEIEFVPALQAYLSNMNVIMEGVPKEYRLQQSKSKDSLIMTLEDLQKDRYAHLASLNSTRITNYLAKQQSLGFALSNLALQWNHIGAGVVLEYATSPKRKVSQVSTELKGICSNYAETFKDIDKDYLIFPSERIVHV